MRRLSFSLSFVLVGCALVFFQCSPEPPGSQDAGVAEKGGEADKSGTTEKAGCASNSDCKTDEFCDGDKCVPDKCKPGTKICDKTFESVLTCNEAGSLWDSPERCASGEMCESGKCVAQLCSPGEKKCDQGGISACNKTGTAFEKPVPCKSDEYCEKGGCLKQKCKPGVKTCEGSTSKTCNKAGSAFELKPCAAKQYCSKGDCKDWVCNPGDKSCDGNTARTCNKRGAGYDQLPCSSQETCDKGTCKPQVCKPKEKRCSDNTTTEVCDSKGLGWTKAPCASGEYCDKGTCTTQKCTPGKRECVNATQTRTCKVTGSAWDVKPCGAGEGCDAGSCKKQICTPGTKRCTANETAEACTANGLSWTKTPCKSGEYCELGGCKTQKCTPNKRECANNSQSRTCKANGSDWVVTSCRAGESCDNAVCKKQVCTPNAKRCAGSFAAEICDAKGLKWTKAACSSSEYCEQGLCKQQVCSPKKQECVNTTQSRSCKADGSAWVPKNCGSGEICDSGVCKKQICKPNAVSCANGTTVQTCDGKGLSFASKVCSSGQYCYQGKCFSGTCKVGVERCTGTNFEACQQTGSGGAWVKIRTCTQGCYTASGKAYCKCANGRTAGQFYCVGKDRYACKKSQKADGEGTKQSTCTYGCYPGIGPAVVKTDQFWGGTLLKDAQKVQINTWVGTPKQNWILCYKSTVYGTPTAAFHKHCDNKGPTVTVVKLNAGQVSERLVGGYANDSWGKSNGYFGDKSSFLFSLTHNYKHRYKQSTSYVLSSITSGPTWGGGHDFTTGGDGDVGNKAYCNLGFTYQCRIGSYGGKDCREDFCGSDGNPVVSEVEVYYKDPGSNLTGSGQAYCKCPGGQLPGKKYCTGKTSYFCQFHSTLSSGSYGSHDCAAGCKGDGYCQCRDRGKDYNHNTTRCAVVNLFQGTTLLTKAQREQINAWVGTKGQNWKLCYKRSVHGGNTGIFHNRCDGKGPTLMVAKLNAGQSTERLIGGYASQSWGGSARYLGDKKSFLFSLTNKYKHAWYRYSNYMYTNNSYGPTWGGGHDFYTNLAGSNYCNLGHSYKCRVSTYAQAACRNDFCGTYRPIVSNLEVFVKDNSFGSSIGSVIYQCKEERLKEGSWSIKANCGANGCLGTYTNASTASAICNICVPKTYRCSGSESQQCTNPGTAYAWTKSATCKYGCYGAGFCKCPAGRTLRQAYCVGNTRYLCVETYDANGLGAKQNTCTHGCYNGTGPATGDTDLFTGGTLLGYQHMKQINTWVGTPHQGWTLCYKRSLHGGNSKTFHSRCDGRGVTVMVVKLNGGQTNERLVGGYASTSWNTRRNYFGGKSSFLFSLTKKYKHSYYRNGRYLYGNLGYGPTWGGGHDFYTNLAGSNYCNIGHSYRCRIGSYGSSTCRNDFCGSYRPAITDMEVYYKGGVPLGGSAQAYCKCIGGKEGGQEYCSSTARYKCNFSPVTDGSGTKLGDCSKGCEVRSDNKAYCK